MAPRTISVSRALLAVILIELAIFYLVLNKSSWSFDDNFFLVLAGQEGFTWHWLTSVQFEHWDIGEHAVISLQHWLFFLDYRWALLAMLGLLGGCMYLLERILATIVKRRWITVAVAAWFGVNILWVRPLQWWAAGVQYFPYTFFDLLCLYAFLRYHADGQRRWIAISTGALAGALLFYEKPAYMIMYLLVLRVLLMTEDLRPRAVLERLWRDRVVWIAYIVVIAIWGTGYIHAHAFTSHGSLAISKYLAYFRILWLQTLVPSMASVMIPPFHLDALQLAFVIAGQVVVLACVVISLRRKRSAWRAWAFLAFTIISTGILVAHARVPGAGVQVGNDARYLVDFSWLVPLAVCAAFAPGKTLKPVVPERSARLSLPLRGARVPLVTALLLLYVVVATATALHIEKIWFGPQAREWEKRIRSGIAAMERSGPRPMVAGNAAPFEIMAEFVAPYNRLSRVLPLYVGPIQVDGPLDAPLVRIANDGTVHHATIATVGPSRSLADLLRSHELVVGPGGRTVWEGPNLCVIADGTAVSVERRLNPVPNVAGPTYYARLAYHVWRPVTLPLLSEPGGGYPPVPYYSLELSPRAQASIAWLGPGTPHAAKLVVVPLTTVCMNAFDIVTLRNAR